MKVVEGEVKRERGRGGMKKYRMDEEGWEEVEQRWNGRSSDDFTENLDRAIYNCWNHSGWNNHLQSYVIINT